MSSHLLNFLTFQFKTSGFQKTNPFASLEAVYQLTLKIKTPENFFGWKNSLRLSPPSNKESTNIQLGFESCLECKAAPGVSYLKDLGAHLTSRAPLSAQLHGESLSILRKHSHLHRVHQHRHCAQTLLLNGVEHNQVPVCVKTGGKQEIREWRVHGRGEKMKEKREWWEYRGPAGSSSIRVRWGRASWVARLSSWTKKRKGIKCKKETNYAGVSHCGARVGAYRLQKGLGLVKAIKLFVLHHQEMSRIYDYSFQADEGAQQSRRKMRFSCFFPKSKISPVQKTGHFKPSDPYLLP